MHPVRFWLTVAGVVLAVAVLFSLGIALVWALQGDPFLRAFQEALLWKGVAVGVLFGIVTASLARPAEASCRVADREAFLGRARPYLARTHYRATAEGPDRWEFAAGQVWAWSGIRLSIRFDGETVTIAGPASPSTVCSTWHDRHHDRGERERLRRSVRGRRGARGGPGAERPAAVPAVVRPGRQAAEGPAAGAQGNRRPTASLSHGKE